jgi:TonB family protein
MFRARFLAAAIALLAAAPASAQGLRGAIHPDGETTAPAAKPAPKPAAAAPAATPPAAPPKPTDAFLLFYPDAAKAAGIEGEAVLHCRRNEHLALTGCVLVSETPEGQGFGSAALKMADQAQDNPKIDQPEVKAAPAADVRIQFTLRPPAITPDITRMAHLFTNPQIVAKPTDAQIQAAYPARALDDQVSGGAAIRCLVTASGKLAACRVISETPDGYGFGSAALDVAADFTMKPGTLDNEPAGDRPVTITVAFTPNDPTAPLSLDTKPPPK